MFRIGSVPIDPPLILAPMAGITDQYFRRILKRIGGVGLVSMEFISSEALTRGSERTRSMMQYHPEERPLAIQIYGSDAARMSEAAAFVEALGADIVDINMGCPANKILKGCSGAALMRDLGIAERIIRACRDRVKIPLTVKFRLGLDDRQNNFLDLGRVCESNGVDAVALHARTARQMFGGRADWPRIRELKEALSIPVSGNGDVLTSADARAMWSETGCDGVMVGRGAMQNPWIFRQTAARLRGEEEPTITLEDRREMILGHFRILREREEERFALHKIRTFTGWYTHGLPNGKNLRQKISTLVTVDSFIQEVESFFETFR
ncbi:MAG TPA: tRNA dihydrouridine synthase DusB, partial [Candidatus Polarisedimenticolia bacterium]|nr:tRNA dihydrouridine synthase DusB [Candidatus Polarisedimenticolia bacterium]